MTMAYLEDLEVQNGDETVLESDESLLSRSLLNPMVFDELVGRYQEAFLRKARRVLGDRPEVEDVVQETFTKIYVHGSKFQPQEGASFSSWGYKILMNTAFTQYQKLKKHGEHVVAVDEEILALAPELSNSHEHRDNRDLVASIISRMPEALARVLSLHFLDDKSQQEIADQEGLSIAAVKTRVHRAKKEFKRISDELSSLLVT